MSTAMIDPLESVIRAAGQDWLIDWYAPTKEALPHLRRKMAEAGACGRARLRENAPDLTAEALALEYERNPHKVTAFLQVIGSVATPDILLMTWRILQGMNITELSVNYQSEQTFQMRVRLSSPDGDETYETTDIKDAVILRHLGILKANGKPIFDGFYPLNLAK